MHELIAEVLPYFVALYVLDSLVFARAHELLFIRPWRSFRTQGRGGVLAGLAPQAEVIAGVEAPLRLGVERVGWPADGGWASVAWGDLGPIEADQRTLRCAAFTTALPSPEAAQHLAAALRVLRDMPSQKRRSELEAQSDAATDLGAIRDLRTRQLRHARALSALGGALGLGWFGVLPALVYGGASPSPAALPALSVLLLLHACVCVLAWRSLRACGVGRGAVLATLSTFAFLLPAAAHSRFVLGRRLYERFDPLALAAVLLPPTAFQAHARREFHRNRLEGDAWPALEEQVGLRARAWRRVVASVGLTPEQVLLAPRADDRNAAAFCPLCALEYRGGFSVCSDCRAPLEPFTAA